MQSTKIETWRLKACGNGAGLKREQAPATPPKNAPISVGQRLRPHQRDAHRRGRVSSSRIAIQARPSRESRRRTLQKIVNSSSTSAVQ